jgi:hypothetical protein
VDFFAEGLGMEFIIFNVYGPYQDCPMFWDSLFKRSLLKVDNSIIGGDLNFSLGEDEVWDPQAHLDHQLDLFTHSMIGNEFIDIELDKTYPYPAKHEDMGE